MSNPVPFTLTNESVTVVWQGKPFTAQAGSPQYAGLRRAILCEEWDTIGQHTTQMGSLKRWLAENTINSDVFPDHKANVLFTVEGDEEGATVLYKGEPIADRRFVARLWAMAAKGESPAPLFRFFERLQENPSMRSVEQLWSFLERGNIPIEPDGHFLAYKGVNDNLTDCHTGTIDNSPGRINEMPRNRISDDPNRACHVGFHVGALGYVNGFGEVKLTCRVDPKDVVCVPYDASSEKMRVCRYEVVGFYGGQPMSSTVATSSDVIDDSDVDYSDGAYDDDVEYQDGAPTQLPDDVLEGYVAPAPVAPPKKKLKKATFDKKDGRALLKESIEDLRRYAGALKIVGASKIPGGKSALVAKILRARRR